jgi:hypothetical protein
MSNKIYFEIYPAGLINQLMSLEIAIGIENETSMETIIYNIPKHLPTLSKYFTKQNNKTIIDLVDWKNKEKFKTFYVGDEIEIKNCEIVNNLQNFYFIKENRQYPNEDHFSGTRKRLLIDSSKNINLRNTLVWYSRFFYEKNNDLKDKMLSIRFKQEYYDLSNKIAKSLGRFNGVHLRLTDHIEKMFAISEKNVQDGIRLLTEDLPIVISTDDADHGFFNKINKDIIILDKYIINNFSNDLFENDFDNDISLAILCNLVLSLSEDFIGSAGSTFTGYVQRGRINNRKKISWKLFGEPEFIPEGPYSWNNFYRGDLERSWWREWEECILI